MTRSHPWIIPMGEREIFYTLEKLVVDVGMSDCAKETRLLKGGGGRVSNLREKKSFRAIDKRSALCASLVCVFVSI